MSVELRNFLIACVGGQGAILATRILASLFLQQGWQVKTSEVHGLAQRGGSVETHVRRGRVVYSPLISPGEVDVLLALEQLEGLRYLPWLRPEGVVVCSTERISPVSVTQGNAQYPDAIKEQMAQRAGTVVWVDALAIARHAGNVRAANVALLGALSPFLEATEEEWHQAISANLPERLHPVNFTAFNTAREMAMAQIGR